MDIVKTALVTGGNKVIGSEITKGFVSLGYKVCIIARNFDDSEVFNSSDVSVSDCLYSSLKACL